MSLSTRLAIDHERAWRIQLTWDQPEEAMGKTDVAPSTWPADLQLEILLFMNNSSTQT